MIFEPILVSFLDPRSFSLPLPLFHVPSLLKIGIHFYAAATVRSLPLPPQKKTKKVGGGNVEVGAFP